MGNLYYLSSLTVLLITFLFLTGLHAQEVKQTVLPPIEKAQAIPMAGNIFPDTIPKGSVPRQPMEKEYSLLNEEEKKSLKSKKFIYQFEDNSITSQLEIIQTNIESKTCEGTLSIKRVRASFYKGFSLSEKDQEYYNYTLSLKGSQFIKSETISFLDIEKGIFREFNFEYSGHFEHISPCLELVAKNEKGFTIKDAIDQYYKATEELDTLILALKEISFLSREYLAPGEKKLEYIKEDLKEISNSEFFKILPLKETDPARYLHKQLLAQDLITQKETECLTAAFKKANIIETTLRSMEFHNPDSLENLKLRLTQNISYFDDISNLILNLNHQKINNLEALLEKKAKINSQLLIKKDELDRAISRKHISYYELGLKETLNSKKREYFEKAILCAPHKFPEPYYQSALIDFKEGDYRKTLEVLDEAMDIFPMKEDVREKCQSLYFEVYEKYLLLGDQAKDSKASLQFYTEAEKVCSNRTSLNFNCEIASQKISIIHTTHFEKAISQGVRERNYDKIQEAKEYSQKHPEFFRGGKEGQINQAFLSLQEANLAKAIALFNEEKLKESRDILKTIKEKERSYEIINNPYHKEWENLAKEIFSEAILYASVDNSSGLMKSKQLIDLCNEMAEDRTFVGLFYEHQHQLKILTIRINKKYFYEKLDQIDEKLNKEEIDSAITIIENAKYESKNRPDWFGEDERTYLNNQEEKTNNAAFYHYLSQVDESIKIGNLTEARNNLGIAEKHLGKTKKENLFELDIHKEKYAEKKVKIKYHLLSQPLSISSAQEEYYKRTIDELLEIIKFSKDSTTKKPLLDSLLLTANYISQEALISSKLFLKEEKFDKALGFAEQALRLDMYLSESISSELWIVLENCLRQESKEILQHYCLGKPEKAERDRLGKLNGRINKYFKTNEGHVMSMELDETIDELTIIEEFYAMHDKIVNLYQKGNYESLLFEYNRTQEFYATHKFSEKGIIFYSLGDFINEKKDRKILEYVIINEFHTPEYQELIPSLLNSFHAEYPDSMDDIGTEIGRKIKQSGVNGRNFLDISFIDTLPKKAFKDLKKGIKRGLKL